MPDGCSAPSALVARTPHAPARAVALAVVADEIDFGIGLGRAAPQQRAACRVDTGLAPTSGRKLRPACACSRRGVASYSARHRASSRVLLPAPVGPLMANRPVDASGSCSKSTLNSPASEARFGRRCAGFHARPSHGSINSAKARNWSCRRLLAEALLPQAPEDVVRLQLRQLVERQHSAPSMVTTRRLGSIFARRTGLPSSAASTWRAQARLRRVEQHAHFQEGLLLVRRRRQVQRCQFGQHLRERRRPGRHAQQLDRARNRQRGDLAHGGAVEVDAQYLVLVAHLGKRQRQRAAAVAHVLLLADRCARCRWPSAA
jgi:hypothetical protein